MAERMKVGRGLWVSLLLLLGLSSMAGAVEVPESGDLAADARLALERRVPLLVVFSAEHCGYCELLEAEILRPMILSGEYEDRVVIRKVMLDEGRELRDFDGRRVEADTLMVRYDVSVTPTMLFLGPDGRELAPRIVGINTPELFGGRVDAAIEAASERLRSLRFPFTPPIVTGS